ncbi:MAG: hypothetical protein U1E95_04435 [Rubrivivax sp.]
MKLRGGRRRDSWDLTALLNAADPRAPRAERHLWLARLMEWLRHAPRVRAPADAAADADAADAAEAPRTPPPVLRLRHLLNVLGKHPAARSAWARCSRASSRSCAVPGCSATSASARACRCPARSPTGCACGCCR